MSRFSLARWLQTLEGRFRAPSRRRPTAVRTQPRRFRPTLETLEDRLVPSTLMVTNTNDSGPGSLRYEISVAQSGDTIQFAPSLQGQTITLTSGKLDVNKNLTIQGLGANQLTVSGNNASRVFDISNDSTVSISGLTIANGSVGSKSAGDSGGGIENEAGSTLNLSNDAVTNNTAYGIGGGLWNQIGATVNISNTTFTGNQALGSLNLNYPDEGFGPGNGTAEGGAIDSDGTATITDSIFTNNLAQGMAGGTVSGGHGGAIGADGPLTVTGSTFTGNQAIGAAIPTGNTTTTSSEGVGGAIIAFDNLTIKDSTFSDNTAHGGDGGAGFVPTPPITISTRGVGGAVAVQGPGTTVDVEDSTFDGNEAIGGAGAAGKPGSLGIGGGMEVSQTNLTVKNSSFTNNEAIGGAGANQTAYDGAGIGGGLSVDKNATAALSGLTMDKNEALGGQDYLGYSGGSAYGGGLSVGSRSIWGSTDSTTVTLTDSELGQNLAEGSDGKHGDNGGNGLGGGVYVGGTVGTSTPSLTIDGGSITKNRAVGGQANAHGTDGIGEGGGVYALGTLTQKDNPDISNNHASTSNDNLYP